MKIIKKTDISPQEMRSIKNTFLPYQVLTYVAGALMISSIFVILYLDVDHIVFSIFASINLIAFLIGIKKYTEWISIKRNSFELTRQADIADVYQILLVTNRNKQEVDSYLGIKVAGEEYLVKPEHVSQYIYPTDKITFKHNQFEKIIKSVDVVASSVSKEDEEEPAGENLAKVTDKFKSMVPIDSVKPLSYQPNINIHFRYYVVLDDEHHYRVTEAKFDQLVIGDMVSVRLEKGDDDISLKIKKINPN
ncbi:hypothetical protein [Penaeicola halotolerans]|uniref:hypothetical protein n=1 Tax=Penaeicola halotolerans TaxID=2793196 RepID=UPI001CF876B2|nr:hypothetical protein [Penaeicola halotolerans]